MKYLHQETWIPLPSTWIRAIELGYYKSWPGLTAELARRHLPKNIHAEKGHLRQERKNLRSNKTLIKPSVMATPDPIYEDAGVQ